MPAKNAMTESDGFSADERAAIKVRAAELRAEGKQGAKKADGLQAVLDSIAGMAPEGSRARRAGGCDRDLDGPRVVVEDLVRNARLRERGRQSRRLLPGRGQVQLPVLDPGLPGPGEPRRRRHVAGGVRAHEVEPRGAEEGRRAGEVGDLRPPPRPSRSAHAPRLLRLGRLSFITPTRPAVPQCRALSRVSLRATDRTDCGERALRRVPLAGITVSTSGCKPQADAPPRRGRSRRVC